MIYRKFLGLVSTMLIGPQLCRAAELSGVVLDPQDLVISGVTVTMSCRSEKISVKTDAQGHFALPLGSKPDGCKISAFHQGFTLFHQVLGASTTTLSIRLTIEPIRDTVTVAAKHHDQGSLRLSTLSAVSLSDTQLRTIANNTEDLIQYAKLLSGASFGSDVVYVDGMPASSLPPAATIAQIKVNADPFAARYADGNQNRIEILTKEPDRQFRLNLGGGSLGVGGRNAIAPNLQSKSHSAGFGVASPVPMLPLTLSLHMSLANNAGEVPIQAVLPPQFPGKETAPRSASTSNRSVSGSVNVACHCPEFLKPNLWYSESRSRLANLGVGALTFPDAGFSSSYAVRSARLTLNKTREDSLFRGGFSVHHFDSNTHANTSGFGLTVVGTFNAGGAAMLSTRQLRSTWNWEGVVEPRSGHLPWTVGLSIAAVDHAKTETPNPGGTFTFNSIEAYTDALGGRQTGNWSGMQGNGVVNYLGLTAGLFLEKEMYHCAHAIVRGGLRLDHQSGFRTLASPRFSGVLDWRGYVFRAGAGLFVRDVPNEVIVNAQEKDGTHLKQIWNPGVALNPIGSLQRITLPEGRVHMSPDLTRPREFLAGASLGRPFGHFSPGAEYTWTRVRRLLGSRRLPDGIGWLDVLESNRSAEKHQLRTRLGVIWKAQALTFQYQWLRSRDDVDGPFSFPEHQDNLRSEWASSSGIPRHVFTLVGNLRFPAEVFLTVTGTWRGSAPYNITTGMDLSGTGLYNDRGGRSRNSGHGLSYQSLSLFVHRRITLPNLLRASYGRISLDLGVYVDNLLGHKNYLRIGSVAGSSTFGQPLGALPGTAVRFSFTLN